MNGERFEQNFTRKGTRMANKCTKSCSALLATREMQIKTRMRCHSIRIRMAKTQNTTASAAERTRPLVLLHCWWGRKMLQPVGKTI